MPASIESRPPGPVSAAGRAPGSSSDRPAARAFARVWRAGVLLGVLGLVSFVPVFARLLERWRVSSHAVSHHVAILGQKLSYPAANAGAVIVVGLALLGASVAAIALVAIGRELIGARRLARRLARLRPVLQDGVYVIDDDRAEAFCAGLFRPRVYITSGALGLVDEVARDAVLSHERLHARRRDPLRLAAGRVVTRSLFFLPGVQELRRELQVLAELSADEKAVHAAAGDRSALARAMLSFSDASEPGAGSGIDPARVDYLLGDAPSWRFPALLFLAAVTLLAIVVTVAILAGREAAGSATLAPPFLAAQPCTVMLALIPCGIGLVALRLGRASALMRTRREALSRSGA
jgi:BlaR1 peptidase M56